MVLKVAICGGGIGGLSLALVLKKFMAPSALAVDLYEAESEFTEMGAGITVWQRTRSIFASLDLQGALENRAVSPPLTLRKSDTKEPFAFHTLVIPRRITDGCIALPRVEMMRLLLESLNPDSSPFLTIHFSKKLASYDQDAHGVNLHFADGSSARADILVGADGLGSPTRKTMCASVTECTAAGGSEKAAAIQQRTQPTWTGTYAYRALLDRERLKGVSPHNVMLSSGFMWCGSGKHVISYPISPTTINILFFDTVPGGLGQPLAGPSVVAVSKEEVVELYKDWEDDLRVAAENVGEMSKWAISHIRGLPQYTDGRVVLLGDSAHAMSTHFGAGAGQAIDDAYILGRILAHSKVTAQNVADALAVYDAIRRPIANDVVERSLRIGFLYEFHPGYLPEGTDVDKLHSGDREELKRISDELQEMWRFHWAEMPEKDWERVCEMLEEKL